jgi:hypothetical protein
MDRCWGGRNQQGTCTAGQEEEQKIIHCSGWRLAGCRDACFWVVECAMCCVLWLCGKPFTGYFQALAGNATYTCISLSACVCAAI